MSALSQPDHLDWRAAHGIAKLGVGKVQAQHAEQHVEQSTKNLGWLVATPDSRKG